MKFICPILCLVLLSSCVHYGVQRDFGGSKNSVCTSGSSKENQRCKKELKVLNESIKNNVPH